MRRALRQIRDWSQSEHLAEALAVVRPRVEDVAVRGDEQRVVDAFAEWMISQGWTVRREVDFCDLVCERNGERLFVEAKGKTSEPGLDIDTAYGQLLRRMPVDDAFARFALAVPEKCVGAATRVPSHVRNLLRIEIFAVSDEGAVRLV